MIPIWRAWFLTRRAYITLFALSVPAIVSVWIEVLFDITVILLALYVITIVTDTVMLWYGKHRVSATRNVAARLDNGFDNQIVVRLTNEYPRAITVDVVDELPVQMQVRDCRFSAVVEANQQRDVVYYLRPVERGEYSFGSINVFVKGALGLVERRLSWEANRVVAVYPAIAEMKRAEMHAFSNRLIRVGTRRQRRIGHTLEFEKIKEYAPGDDQRTINWQATARSGELKVNLFQDERSQDVISVLDLGRVMRSPFNGMTSLDYAVNAALAFSNVVLRKGDRAGLITYGSNGSTMVKPSGIPAQLGIINESLYNVSTQFDESNDEQLVLRAYSSLRQRSLLMMYTNIDAMVTLHRRLANLLILARRHVLVVVLFDNHEVKEMLKQPIEHADDVYSQMVARDYVQQKYDMVHELRKHGIHCIVSAPEQLSVASIDKYLELKARGIV